MSTLTFGIKHSLDILNDAKGYSQKICFLKGTFMIVNLLFANCVTFEPFV